MRLFEYCNKKNLFTLSEDQRLFVSNLIVKKVKKAAKELGITEEDAYWRFSRGLIEGSDREIN